MFSTILLESRLTLETSTLADAHLVRPVAPGHLSRTLALAYSTRDRTLALVLPQILTLALMLALMVIVTLILNPTQTLSVTLSVLLV